MMDSQLGSYCRRRRKIARIFANWVLIALVRFPVESLDYYVFGNRTKYEKWLGNFPLPHMNTIPGIFPQSRF